MKKLFTVLAVLLVATALFAQVGLTVKAGGAFGFASNKSVADVEAKSGTQTEKGKWEDLGLADKALIFKTNGFGFDVGVQYDITDKLLAYVDFNMLFPKDVKSNTPGNFLMLLEDAPEEVIEKYAKDNLLIVYSLEGLLADLEKYCDLGSETYPLPFKDNVKTSTKFSFFSVSAGVAYKLDLNAIKLNVGGGISMNKATAVFTMEGIEKLEDLFGKYEYKVSFASYGLNAMVEAKYMVAENIGVGVTLMPQIGLYNSASFVANYTEAGATETETESFTSKGFAVNFAMPIVVGVSYTF